MSGNSSRNANNKAILFPKVSECQHFHYNSIHFTKFRIELIDDNLDDRRHQIRHKINHISTTIQLRVQTSISQWTIYRNWDQLSNLDQLLHQCIFCRHFSSLDQLLSRNLNLIEKSEQISRYLRRLNTLLDNSSSGDVIDSSSALLSLNCVLVLNWFESDPNGRHLIDGESAEVNRRGIGAAFVVKQYPEATDTRSDTRAPKIEVFLSLEIGELISIIELNSIIEDDVDCRQTQTTRDDRRRRFWSKGKKGFEVGFFPSDCVQLLSTDNVLNALNEKNLIKNDDNCNDTDDDTGDRGDRGRQQNERNTQTLNPNLVLRKNNKISAFFQKLVSHERPNCVTNCSKVNARGVGRIGVVGGVVNGDGGRGGREGVFGCDLAEQLFDSCRSVPTVVTICSQFIESKGLLDGIYRLSGISSNISKLRQMFDKSEIPDLENDASVVSDIHCVSSVLKLYFRMLPNPLLTFHLYDAFVQCIRGNNQTTTATTTTTDGGDRCQQIRRLVVRLPPPHYRTLKALIKHLHRVSKAAHLTGMTPKNLAIVWAPNLLRSRELQNNRSVNGDLAALQLIGTQAILTEYMIENCEKIFDDNELTTSTTSTTAHEECNQINDDIKDDTNSEFCRRYSEKIFKNTKQLIFSRNLENNVNFQSKSFESFFTKKVQKIDKNLTKNNEILSNLCLSFGKIENIIDLNQVLPQFGTELDNIMESVVVWTTEPKINEFKANIALNTTSETTDVFNHSLRLCATTVRDDTRQIRQQQTTPTASVDELLSSEMTSLTTIVFQIPSVCRSLSSRERIERIKSIRRQQLRQQFDDTTTKLTPTPTPTPRKSSVSAKLRQIGPKVDTRRPQTTTVPVPTPRRRNSSCEVVAMTTNCISTPVSSSVSSPTITITTLKTSSKSKRNNWNTSAAKVFEPKREIR